MRSRAVLVLALVLAVPACAKKAAAPAFSGSAGCSDAAELPNAGQTHIAPPAKGTYNSDPPTSGAHYSQGAPNGPGFTGVHIDVMADEVQVHNLEHGHVGIQYDPTKIDPAVKSALEQVTKAHAQFVYMAPRPTLKVPLAFTAWRRLSTCPSASDATAIKAFAEAFYTALHDKAPESIPGTPAP